MTQDNTRSALPTDNPVVQEGLDVLDTALEETTQDTPHVVLGLFDRDGQIDVECIQYPEAYDANSPAHVIGRWLQINIAQVVEAARLSAAHLLPATEALRVPDHQIILP